MSAMSSEPKTARPMLDLSKWRKVPMLLMSGGGVLALIGAIFFTDQFAFSWLQGFMFCFSLCVGALFLVLMHHLFDAGWSVPIRRFCEHIATLSFPVLFLLFLPILLWKAPTLYEWMREANPDLDPSLKAKLPLFTKPGFYITSIACFLIWWFLTRRLRYWSLRQDKTGDALPTYKMRFLSAIGIVLFAITVTWGSVLWMKALQHEWYSTMYGV